VTKEIPSSIACVGIIETTALAAASAYYRLPSPHIPEPSDSWFGSPRDQFFAFLHNLILYEELRTDFQILEHEPPTFEDAVRGLLDKLSPDVKFSPTPHTLEDRDLSRHLTPILIAKIKSNLEFKHPFLLVHEPDEDDDENDIFYMAKNYKDRHNATQRVGKELDESANAAVYKFVSKLAGTPGSSITALQLLRTSLVLARTIKYAAHASYLKENEGIPAVYCAARRRMELLKQYTDNSELASIKYAAQGFFDLLGGLGLPPVGYTFRTFAETLNPIPFSELSKALEKLPPHEALLRTIELRNGAAARQIRIEWANRLWEREGCSAEGLGMSVRYARVRDLTMIQYFAAPAVPTANPEQAIPTQSVDRVKAKGKISQWINRQQGRQSVSDSQADALSQQIVDPGQVILAEFNRR
jgi:hypothetical protein